MGYMAKPQLSSLMLSLTTIVKTKQKTFIKPLAMDPLHRLLLLRIGVILPWVPVSDTRLTIYLFTRPSYSSCK